MTETDLRTTLGLTEEQMQSARDHLPDVWKKTARGYTWSEDGIDALLSYLETQKEPAGPQTLTVSRIPLNRHIVHARIGEVEVIVTHVKNNALLTPRQLIRAEKKDGRWCWHGPHPVRKGQILFRK